MANLTVTLILLLAAVVVGYLLGSLNAAIIVSRALKGEDIRNFGSGNAGMTNMLRTYGKGPAALTAVVDFAKAAVAIVLARLAVAHFGLEFNIDIGYIAGIAAMLGHIFPIYFGFKGGKGVMTALGVMLCVNPLVFLIVAGASMLLILITRYVSVGSILGSLSLPFVTWAVLNWRGQPPMHDALLAGVIGLLIIVMHKENIKRLLSGTENRFGRKGRS
ncbi:MAG: glycerol-3-phosphate 1-O-acyltransferase PlsY [Oscillospiraceae bacterium]|nr:glycerol-3-phosphate 1-O-acyltransferase PlsY [Oscillospiraceae bacterium]